MDRSLLDWRACKKVRKTLELVTNSSPKLGNFPAFAGLTKTGKARELEGFGCSTTKLTRQRSEPSWTRLSESGRTWVRFGFDKGYSTFLNALEQCYAYRKMSDLA